jgi:hypothetical protein
MAKSVSYESTIERDLLFFLEFDPSVIHYEAQPLTIKAITTNGIEYSYTPDFEVKQTDSFPQLVECKPLALLQVEHTLRQIEIGKNWCNKNNYNFVVVTDADLRTGPRLFNLKFYGSIVSNRCQVI